MTTDSLLNCVLQEIKIAGEIVQKLDAQHKALLELDMAGLEASVPSLEGLAGEMRDAEERRLEAARNLAVQHELPADTPLRELLKAVSVRAGEELEQARARLGALIEEIYHQNHTNYLLMLNAARFNRAVLQYISGITSTYARDGVPGEAGQAPSIILDKKA